jgi:hypothetical protein
MNTVNDNFKGLADDLGLVRAQMADLKVREEKIRAAIIATGEPIIEADLFRAVLITQNRTQIDWQAIAKKLKPSRQLIKAYTERKEVIQIKTSSRQGDVA